MTASGKSASPSKAVPKALRPFDANNIKILLLENVNQTAVKILTEAGYQVEHHTKALPEDVLKEKIRDVHAVGIRSKTQLTADVLKEAKKLQAIGCFCIGTNQVDLDFASKRGIAVFNSPFSNSRSVAEMMISEIIMLARQLGDRNNEMHKTIWNKVSANCFEIRAKTLGIVGYGHIGTQLSVLAESMGMNVIFYDILQIMPLGTAKPMASLQDLLKTADFVTLHVPETPETINMIGEKELQCMKNGSYLINASRGTVVDIPALVRHLKSGHLAGAAIDVFPSEPASNGPNWITELQGCSNTILTPHIGGSTEEAQSSIGIEVGSGLVRFINYGSTLGSVNMPEVDLRVPSAASNTVRLINIHHNVPGVLKQINKLLDEFNIEKQMSDSKGDVAYVMADITIQKDLEANLKKIYESVSGMVENIGTRVLY
ncbi:hypothetical protein BKA69DRAFT_1027698 [Paraphysoderma sedebokerense]|nr:hypothetical protein BKA69DRAFT_1027698 [Paraphysoderma sedebokerense]